MQDRWDAVHVGCREGGMQDRWEAGHVGCRTGGMYDRRDERHVGCRNSRKKVRMDAVPVGCRTGGMQDRWNTGQERCRTSRMQDRWDAELGFLKQQKIKSTLVLKTGVKGGSMGWSRAGHATILSRQFDHVFRALSWYL